MRDGEAVRDLPELWIYQEELEAVGWSKERVVFVTGSDGGTCYLSSAISALIR
jgi:hypothetical protein